MEQLPGTRRPSLRPNPSGRRWFVLFLALSLWRGPLPWMHTHADEPAATDGGPQLAWHLQWLHPQLSLPDSLAGWHWHFVLPNDFDGDGRQDGESGEQLATITPLNADDRDSLSLGDRDLLTFELLLATPPLGAAVRTPPDASRDRRAASPPQFRAGEQVRLLASVALC